MSYFVFPKANPDKHSGKDQARSWLWLSKSGEVGICARGYQGGQGLPRSSGILGQPDNRVRVRDGFGRGQ